MTLVRRGYGPKIHIASAGDGGGGGVLTEVCWWDNWAPVPLGIIPGGGVTTDTPPDSTLGDMIHILHPTVDEIVPSGASVIVAVDHQTVLFVYPTGPVTIELSGTGGTAGMITIIYATACLVGS